MTLSGTSMATGVTSGVVAVVLDAASAAHPNAPALTPGAIKAILEYTALPLSEAGVPYDALTQGTGGLNSAGAIVLAQSIDPSAPVCTPCQIVPVTLATTIGGENPTRGCDNLCGPDHPTVT